MTFQTLQAVVFDWAGTVIDFGSQAPMGAFVELFARHQVAISIAEARGPMGLPKWHHIQALGQQPRIANGHDQLALDDALDVDFVGDELHVRAHFARELDLARTQRTAPAGQLQPGQVKTDELPHGIEPQAAGHDRVALKVAGKEPQVGFDIELGADLSQPVRATIAVDVRDAVKHQHGRQRQAPAVGAEQPALARGDQLFVGKGICHFQSCSRTAVGPPQIIVVCNTAPSCGALLSRHRELPLNNGLPSHPPRPVGA